MTTLLGIALFLVAVSYAGVGPEPVRLMQSVRLVNLLPPGLGLMAAIAVDAALRDTPLTGHRGVLLATAVVVTAGLVFVPVFSFATKRGYEPAWVGQDALAGWLEEHNYGQPGRVWMEGAETSWYTFRDFGKLRSARSPFVQGDWSLLARPLQEGILVGDPNWQTTEDYLKAMAISYLFVPDNSAASQLLHEGGEPPGPYPEQLHVEGFPSETLYKAPWDPVVAFVMDANILPPLDFPSTQYKSQDERKSRDHLTHAYTEVAYSRDATPVDVQYPSPTTMRMRLAGLPLGRRLVISENWDRSWRAGTSDGKNLHVNRYGPNYIEVDVSQLSGNVVIELRHEMSWDWKAGIGLTVFSLPVAVGAMLVERRRRS